MSKFHEPWSVVDDFDIVDAYDSEVASEYSGFESKVYAARTVSCVNALAGVENPTKWVSNVKELIRSIAYGYTTVDIINGKYIAVCDLCLNISNIGSHDIKHLPKCPIGKAKVLLEEAP